eukprot:jgi/Mesvir1/18650/Mv17152-RA.1
MIKNNPIKFLGIYLFRSFSSMQFANRAHITFKEKSLTYETVEALHLQEDGTYSKITELLEANPSGLVPVLVDMERPSDTFVVCDSENIIAYVDERWTGSGIPALQPTSPRARARCRSSSALISKRIVPSFYRTVMTNDATQQREAASALDKALAEFDDALAAEGGPFFLGSQFTLVDILLAPFGQRFPVLAAYRGWQVPAGLERLQKWLEAIHARPSVADTLPASRQEELIHTYSRYADGTANSKVAEAIRSGGSSDDV